MGHSQPLLPVPWPTLAPSTINLCSQGSLGQAWKEQPVTAFPSPQGHGAWWAWGRVGCSCRLEGCARLFLPGLAHAVLSMDSGSAGSGDPRPHVPAPRAVAAATQPNCSLAGKSPALPQPTMHHMQIQGHVPSHLCTPSPQMTHLWLCPPPHLTPAMQGLPLPLPLWDEGDQGPSSEGGSRAGALIGPHPPMTLSPSPHPHRLTCCGGAGW